MGMWEPEYWKCGTSIEMGMREPQYENVGIGIWVWEHKNHSMGWGIKNVGIGVFVWELHVRNVGMGMWEPEYGNQV